MAEGYTLRDVILYALSQAELTMTRLTHALFFAQYLRIPPYNTLYVLSCCGELLARAAFTIQDGRVWSASIVNELEDMEALVEIGDARPPSMLALTERGVEEARRARERIPAAVRVRIWGVVSAVKEMRLAELVEAAAYTLGTRPDKLVLYNGWSVERVAEENGLGLEKADITPLAQLLGMLCTACTI